MEIILRRHKINFYLAVYFQFLFFVSCGLLFILFDFKPKKSLISKEFAPYFGALFILAGIYFLWLYYNNAPVIKIKNGLIYFTKKEYNLSEIAAVDLGRKKRFSSWFALPMEATTIMFKDGTEKIVYDSFYKNIGSFKLFLKQHFSAEKTKPQFLNKSIPQNIDYSWYQTFNGNQFTSMRGIVLWGSIIAIGYMIITSKIKMQLAHLPILFFIICLAYLWSRFMNYFIVTNEILIVKTHNLFWRKKVFYLDEIEEIVFEEPHRKSPQSLRVISKDFSTKLYPAGTLRDKTWIEMRDFFKSKNIKVRVEFHL